MPHIGTQCVGDCAYIHMYLTYFIFMKQNLPFVYSVLADAFYCSLLHAILYLKKQKVGMAQRHSTCLTCVKP